MERTGLFALARGGLTLVREDSKLYVFGLVVGGLIAFSAAFVKQAMSDITSDSLDAEILAAVGDGPIVLPVFGPLTLVANAALVTYAVRVAQGHPSVGDAVDRVRHRVWRAALRRDLDGFRSYVVDHHRSGRIRLRRRVALRSVDSRADTNPRLCLRVVRGDGRVPLDRRSVERSGELENTEGEEVTELTIVCSDLAT